MFAMNFTSTKDFRPDELVVFRSIEKKIGLFFHFFFDNDLDVNHCSEEDKVFVLGLIRNVIERYNMEDTYYCDVCTAVFLSFYSLVLLELYSTTLSLEAFCSFVRLQSDAVRKINEIYYGIAWGDDPTLAEVRRRMLFPCRETYV